MTALDFVLCIPTLSPAGAKRTLALIVQAEQSVCAPMEYFVVDNGGHFEQPAGQENPKVVVFRPPSNIGVGPAWNAALRLYGQRAPEAAIIFANDDIGLDGDGISALIGAALADKSKTMFVTDGHRFTFFMLRPEHVRRFGYFDEGFAPAYYEDTDYIRRMGGWGYEGVAVVKTGVQHKREQSTSKDLGWDAEAMIAHQSLRYEAKWGGLEGKEKFAKPWDIDFEVCVPSCNTHNLQRLIDSLAWQSVRPSAVTIASNADIQIDTRGLLVRQVKFWSDAYAIGEGDVSLRRNVASWAATSPYLVYSDDDQVWPQNAMEWFARRFATGAHFVVGHHRFVVDMDSAWKGLRNAKAETGAAREFPPNVMHSWQSCWGGCVGANAMLLKYGVGGWDMAYPQGEDQQLARRVAGGEDDGEIHVYEPPWAWHEKDAIHSAPWTEPHANVCARGTHSMVTILDGAAAKCSKCPLIRRATAKWPVIQTYDSTLVRTEARWL